MAHDRQFRDSPLADVRIKEYGYPEKGDTYWNRTRHAIEVADRDISIKHAIMERAVVR